MRFRLLGPMEVVSPSEGRVDLPYKQRIVLAVLLLCAGQAVPLSDLIDAVWQDRPPSTARHAIAVYVSEIRQILQPTPHALTAISGSYLVAVDRSAVDAHLFADIVGDAGTQYSRGEWIRARDLLRRANALWRGPALADFSEDRFAIPDAARLEELHLRSLEMTVQCELNLGAHQTVLPELRAHVVRYPLHERFTALLAVALYRSSRQAEALVQLRSLRTRLVHDLGIDPGPEIRELERRILTQDPSLAEQRDRRSGQGGTTSTRHEHSAEAPAAGG